VARGSKSTETYDLGHGWEATFETVNDGGKPAKVTQTLDLRNGPTGEHLKLSAESLHRLRKIFKGAK
jgi:hypothetical protein